MNSGGRVEDGDPQRVARDETKHQALIYSAKEYTIEKLTPHLERIVN